MKAAAFMVYTYLIMKNLRLTIIISFIALLIVAVGGGIIYLQDYYLPIHIKSRLTDAIELYTSRSASIKSARYTIIKGITLEGVTIFSEDTTTEFLKIDRLNLNPLVIPFFKEKKLIIPSLDIEGATLNLIRSQDLSWNIPKGPFAGKPEALGLKGKFSFIINSVNLTNGTVNFEDRTLEQSPSGTLAQPFTATLSDLSLKSSLALPASVKIGINFKLKDSDAPSLIAAGIDYSFIAKDITINLALDKLLLQKFAPYIKKHMNMDVSKGTAKAAATIKFSGANNLSVSAHEILIESADIKTPNTQITGSLALSGNASLIPRDLQTLKFDAQASLKGVDISGIPRLGALEDIEGTCRITEGGISTEALSCIVHGSRITLAGTAHNFKDLDFNLNLASPDFNLAKLKLILPEMNATLLKNAALTGIRQSTLHLKGRLFSLKDAIYEAAIEISEGEFSGLPNLDTINAITGNLSIKNNLVETKNLQLEYKQQKANVSGSIQNFNDPSIDISATSEISLDKAQLLLPSKFRDTTFTGSAPSSVSITGKFKPTLDIKYKGTSRLDNITVQLSQLDEPLKVTSGIAGFSNGHLDLKNISLEYKNETYAASASVTNFRMPDVVLSIQGKGLAIDSEFIVGEKATKISKFDGSFKGAAFSLNGEAVGFKDPVLNVEGILKLNLENLKNLFPAQAETLEGLSPKGRINLAAYINGRLKEYKGWLIIAKGNADYISVKNYKLKNAFVDVRMKDRKLYLVKLTASPYRGSLEAQGELDLNGPNPSYALEAVALDLDLNDLVKDSPITKKEIAGALSTKFLISGFGKNLETMKGTGWVAIREGYLFELPVFKGLLSVLSLSQSRKAIFREAYGTFAIDNQLITTRDLTLLSDELTLNADGSLGFNKGLDFKVNANFAEGLALRDDSFGRLEGFLRNEAGTFFGEIRVTGTLGEPKYKLVPAGISGFIKKKIGTILEGILR